MKSKFDKIIYKKKSIFKAFVYLFLLNFFNNFREDVVFAIHRPK